MIDLNYIRSFFPTHLQQKAGAEKYMLKEYIQWSILDYLSTSRFIDKLTFIGGTNLRIIKGIDRFSEDLDFDCKDLSHDEFLQMTDSIIQYLLRQGLQVEVRDKTNSRLTAFRRSLFFPQLLFTLGLTAHREERFLIKVEAQDQEVPYQRHFVNVAGCGYFTTIPVPSDAVLLSMKLSAMLTRAKGRDFYDTMFLWQQTQPDYPFLTHRVGIKDPASLRTALHELLKTTNLEQKRRDFTHLLFDPASSQRILRFPEFIDLKTTEGM